MDGIENIGVGRVDLHRAAVTATDPAPKKVSTALDRAIVLGSAINAVKRLCVVGRGTIELGNGQVANVPPGIAEARAATPRSA